jgi:hypothetical protein
LPAFFFPNGFITAQRQQVARRGSRKESLEKVEVSFSFREPYSEIRDFPEKLFVTSGCLIYGLVYDGASWNPDGYLDEPRTVYNELPVLHMEPKIVKQSKEPVSHVDDRGRRQSHSPIPIFICPIYNTPDRMGSVLGHLRHELNQLGDVLGLMHFRLRGVVALCQTDD